MRSGGVQNAAEKGRAEGKNLEKIKGGLEPCNPLKSHKIAKEFFGKAWSKTRDFWRSLEKGLEGAFIPPPLAPSHQRPPIKRDRHCEERSDEATGAQRHAAPGWLRCATRSSAKSGLSIRKSGRPVSSNGIGWRTVREL